MKKNSFILLILTLFCTKAPAQDIKPYFTIIPDNVLGYVNIGLRKDLIDLYDAKQNAQVRNLLGGTTRLEFMSPQYMKLNLSENTEMELRMIQESNDSTGLIIVNKTLKTAYPESVLAVYSTDWKSKPAESYYKEPLITDYLIKDLSQEELSELYRVVPYRILKIEMDSVSNRLLVYPEFLNSMSKDDKQKWKAKFKDKPITYRWKEGHYEKE